MKEGALQLCDDTVIFTSVHVRTLWSRFIYGAGLFCVLTGHGVEVTDMPDYLCGHRVPQRLATCKKLLWGRVWVVLVVGLLKGALNSASQISHTRKSGEKGG